MIADLRAGRSFYHTRYNDGEISQLLGLLPDGTVASNNRYNPEMKAALRQTILDVFRSRGDAVYIGSILKTDPTHPTAVAFRDWLSLHGIDVQGPDLWPGEFFCQEESVDGEAEIGELLNLLRASKRCVLVCNPRVAPIARALHATVVLIPEIDAWAQRERIAEILRFSCQTMLARIYLWCAGIPAKPWSWQIRRRDPHSTHIDMGHLFDGFMGDLSRSWMSKDTPMTRYYFGAFAGMLREMTDRGEA